MLARPGRLIALLALLAALVPAAAQAGRLSPSVEPASKLAPNFAPLLAAGGHADAIVRFRGGAPSDRAADIAAAGLRLGPSLTAIPAAQVTGPVEALAALASRPDVEYIEANEQLRFFDETGVWAIRARQVQEPLGGGAYTAGGNLLDGTGVGVAVVDSGADGTHPDLADHIVHNYKMVGSLLVDVGNLGTSDATSGHGTHVAGIVAGDGTASSGSTSSSKPNLEGTVTGVAPNASLTVYATGEGINVLWATFALDHINANYSNTSVFPQRIRVINNSWGNGAGSAYDPNSTISLTVKSLVNKGAVVVFAAGNDGGNGSADRTNGYCKDPTPGVICAANYDDFGTGTRDGGMDSSSSRGRNGSPTTYPDISAPGAFINSTCSPHSGALCNAAGFITRSASWPAFYGDASGTSMAAPMVAGAAALLLQAKPSLTPAQVEDLFLDTAHKFGTGYQADPQNSGGTTSFDRGAGLLDLVAALSAAGVNRPAGSTPTVLADNDGGDAAYGATDLVKLAASTSASSITLSVTVANAAALPPNGNATIAVDYTIDGNRWTTAALLDSSGATALDTDAFVIVTAPASSATLSGNTLTMVVPKSVVSSPAAGSAAYNIRARSFVRHPSAITDLMPSAVGSTAADAIVRPLFARPFLAG